MSDSFLAAVALRLADLRTDTRPKVVLFVRHGQSMHNISSVAAHSDQGDDMSLFDAELSPLGQEQVTSLAGHESLALADLAVVSPLARAIQTMFGAFPDAGAHRVSSSCPPIEVWPSMSEHMTDSCDIGTGKCALARRFGSLDFDPVPEVWWYVDEETSTTDPEDSRKRYQESGFMEPERVFRKRADAFVDALYARRE